MFLCSKRKSTKYLAFPQIFSLIFYVTSALNGKINDILTNFLV